MSNPGGFQKGFLRTRRIPEIAFHVGNGRRLDQVFRHIVWGEAASGTEIRAHAALGVWRYHNKAARGRWPVCGGRGGKVDSERPDVMGKDLAQLIIPHLADIGGGATKRCETRNRIAARPARDFDGRAHNAIKLRCTVFIDQRHGAFFDTVGGKKIVSPFRNDINNRIADTGNIKLGF